MMMVLVQTNIRREVGISKTAEPVVRRVVRATCDRARPPRGRWGWVVDVTFVDSATIRHYNETYRGEDEATDVLSFSLADGGEDGDGDHPIPTNLTLLGDVLICPEQMSGERNELHQLALLACHGTLHLLGWTHDDQEAAEEMERVTEEALADVLPRRV